MAASSSFQLKDIFDHNGRIALVTGGGTGIGWMIAQGLAANGAKGMYATTQIGLYCVHSCGVDDTSVHHWPPQGGP